MNEITDEIEVPRERTHPFVSILRIVVIPGAVIASGLFCTGLLIASKSSAERKDATPAVPVVSVTDLTTGTRVARIQGTGQVVPAQQVRLTPEVQGRVTRESDRLLPGASFERGETLAVLDGRVYRAAVAAQEQAVARAELELATERSRTGLAARQWEVLGDPDQADTALALRQPQLNAAEKGLEAARAALESAKVDLARTVITAPFNGVVTEESISVGQLVGPTTPIATFVGTDAYRVEVSVPVERLEGIQLGDPDTGSAAEVTQRLGLGRSVVRQGYVRQIGGQLDPESRTATVVVEIPSPNDVDGLPLLPGAHVTVDIAGRDMQDTWEIPRAALVDGQFAWMVDQENSLRRRTLDIGWRTESTLVVTDGIEPGDRLVVGPLVLPVDGQAVTIRTAEEG